MNKEQTVKYQDAMLKIAVSFGILDEKLAECQSQLESARAEYLAEGKKIQDALTSLINQ